MKISSFHLRNITLTGLGLIVFPVAAQEYYFNPAALEMQDPGQQTADLERLFRTGEQMPGNYRVDIYMNGSFVETRSINFVMADNKLAPELTVKQLAEMGVKTQALPALTELSNSQAITPIGNYIPDASTDFSLEEQRLDISIPQTALDTKARGFIDPSQWDQGIPALLLNYTASGANTRRAHQGENSQSSYLNLQSGINMGPWRLRNYSTYSRSSDGQNSWDSAYTYFQRDIHALKSQLILGESSTPGMVFDSNAFTGVQLTSDDNMLPDSMKGFAPVVRGIAKSNAQVTVKQNGYTIYQTYVAPGQFEITDLYPTSASGDLYVTVTEADGSKFSFVQPFSAVPLMLRQGQTKFSVVAGRYRSASGHGRQPQFGQTSLIYGLYGATTVYGGMLAADNYLAASLGVGHGFGTLGSVSFDVTQAKSELRDESTHSGQSYRIQYAKDFAETGTTFTLASYRYSTQGFYTFQEANEMGYVNDPDSTLGFVGYNNNKRSKFQLNLNQSFKAYGSVYISAFQQDYWRMSGYQRTVNLGYSQNIAGIGYNLGYSYSQMPDGQNSDRQVSFSVQVPLSRFLPNSWATYSVNTASHGSVNQQAGISGTALEDNNLDYSVQQSLGNQGQGYSGNASVRYKGSKGEVNAGYNYTKDYQQVNYGAQGGIVVHPYGVTLSQSLSDTIALVRAPGAAGLKLENNTGVYTDSRGYAVVPYVSTYRHNRVALDTRSMGGNVDIDTTVQTVTPTHGAVVVANFTPRIGKRAVITLRYQGKPVPFGATATLVQEESDVDNSALVGDGGQVYLSGVPEKGTLTVQWGKTADKQCKAPFTLPSADNHDADVLQIFAAICQ
ncbi:fimbrial biogenesis outer membrane usher protein [Enterobacter asburiae]|uniref:fimbria/pilus outer membrane usher protein n=1 Tax=Enterobacter asburiae TaxID=61645 RepID=UPI002075F81D|nr:fimbria/pilus outer membrane usher protein [Enterobacter asburiae]MCM7773444.1 fimbrial biogenesis outer membrane usher protein [Enterobacter asburiae]